MINSVLALLVKAGMAVWLFLLCLFMSRAFFSNVCTNFARMSPSIRLDIRGVFTASQVRRLHLWGSNYRWCFVQQRSCFVRLRLVKAWSQNVLRAHFIGAKVCNATPAKRLLWVELSLSMHEGVKMVMRIDLIIIDKEMLLELEIDLLIASCRLINL